MKKEKSEKRIQYLKDYYQKNKEKIIEKTRTYLNSPEGKIKRIEYREKNRNKQREYDTNPINKEKRNERLKKQRENNPKRIKPISDENRVKRNLRVRQRMATEPLFKLKKNIRTLISQTLKNKGVKKSLKSEQILGCTYQQFKEHIEKQFESWMSWDNYGTPKDKIFELNKTWDIDHIIPLKTATCEADIIRLNHYTNLRPLCSYYNRFIKRAN